MCLCLYLPLYVYGYLYIYIPIYPYIYIYMYMYMCMHTYILKQDMLIKTWINKNEQTTFRNMYEYIHVMYVCGHIYIYIYGYAPPPAPKIRASPGQVSPSAFLFGCWRVRPLPHSLPLATTPTTTYHHSHFRSHYHSHDHSHYHSQLPPPLPLSPPLTSQHKSAKSTKLTVSLKFCKAYHTKLQKLKGGRWRYKLTASLSLPYEDTNMQG